MQKADLFATKTGPCQDTHDCEAFTVKDADGEYVCIRCGKVDELTTSQDAFYDKSENDDKASSVDHNAGNGLFDSQTLQQRYVSPRNLGLAMMLNNTRQKDAQGKKVCKQLRDPYKAGLLADPTVGYHIETDNLTGQNQLKFSRYDAPLLPFLKETALQRCISYQLDVVGQTLIAHEIKRLYSNLMLSSVADYVALAAILKYQHLLPRKERAPLERELIQTIETIRTKLLSGCQSSKDRNRRANKK